MLTTHNKMLEAQIIQQATSSSKPLGKFPSKNELRPGEQCNSMILRGGKQLQEPKGFGQYEHSHSGNDELLEKEDLLLLMRS